MKQGGRILSSLLFLLLLMEIGGSTYATAEPGTVWVLQVDGAIGPVTSDYITSQLSRAHKQDVTAVVIQLDTPGGLLESTRLIVKEFLNSAIPIIIYVYPSGARAASAGVFITMAAHIAVMAPGTHIGAAHPVGLGGGQIDSTMAAKMENDAASYIRSIAERRGRNVDWAERAVRESVSITETEALEQRVIDLVVPSLDSLLVQIDGKRVETAVGERILHTRQATVRSVEMDLRYKILNALSNPNLAYLLLMLGFYGLFFELSNPGAIFPGVVGGICLILALFALQTLPINYAGLLLIFLALVLFIAEIKVTSYGLLTGGGIIAFVLGSMMLIESPLPFLRISWHVIAAMTAATTLLFLVAISLGLNAQRSRVKTGVEGFIGEIGRVQTPLHPQGWISVHGERWMAISERPLDKGTLVRVEGMKGLKLRVKAVKSAQQVKAIHATEKEESS